MLFFCFSISGIAFYKLGLFPCFIKSNTLSLSWQYSHQVNYYLSSEYIALSLFFLSCLLSSLRAVGEKILKQKGFFFLALRCFLLTAQT